jgi:hypothetical protein
MPNSINFQKSITKELEVVKDRVRDLIGQANWPEEGRYKEAILSKSIENQLPNHISVGTGFIVRQTDQETQIISKQHDIILYDNRYPVIMKYGNFIVTTPTNTLGVIEVKSNINPTIFRETFTKLESSLEPIFDNYQEKFIGIFSFNFKKPNRTNYTVSSGHVIKDTLKSSKKIVNHISLNEKTFIRFWRSIEGRELSNPIITHNDFYNVYDLRDLSFSYFISNILHRICDNIDERYWHSFPIIGTKEENRIETIEIE